MPKLCETIRAPGRSSAASFASSIRVETLNGTVMLSGFAGAGFVNQLVAALRDLSPRIELEEGLRRRAELPLLRMLAAS